MHPRRALGYLRSVPFVFFAALSIGVMGGCGTTPIPGSDGTSRPRTGEGGEALANNGTVVEDGLENSGFAAAQPATLPMDATLVIEGAIDFGADVDIYALGPASAGDLIVVDVAGYDGLNTVAALFDGAEDLLDASDDRSYYAGILDPYIARVVRVDTDNLYLGVAVSRAAHFASNAGRFENGSYTVRVRRDQGMAVPVAVPQLVYLSFQGGDRVQIGLEPIEDMRRFSAESISGRLAGQTDYIVGLILEHMRRDYAAFDVTLVDSKTASRPSESHSTLYFGNFNESYLGLADNVDTGNAYLVQEAIIYTEDLALFESLVPSAEEIALGLANIASHELGHLLGLEHSAEVGDLMATASSARQIIELDAAFARTQVQEAVFPIGWQNGPNVLYLNVGANPLGSRGGRVLIEDPLPRPAPSFRDAMSDIPIVQCGRRGGGVAGGQ